MAAVMGCDTSSEIPTSSHRRAPAGWGGGFILSNRRVKFYFFMPSYLIHLAYANEPLNLVRGRVGRGRWEREGVGWGGEHNLVTCMGECLQPS